MHLVIIRNGHASHYVDPVPGNVMDAFAAAGAFPNDVPRRTQAAIAVIRASAPQDDNDFGYFPEDLPPGWGWSPSYLEGEEDVILPAILSDTACTPCTSCGSGFTPPGAGIFQRHGDPICLGCLQHTNASLPPLANPETTSLSEIF